MLWTVGGRPGSRRLRVSCFAASLLYQANSIADVTRKTLVRQLRGISRATAVSQARSARDA
jgi:hypothetical protein